ncbi:hypothetical protein [[Phormidium] sp. ETS-05]|nr:hypothetical protein [[Phormidium] sp. ETS-05]
MMPCPYDRLSQGSLSFGTDTAVKKPGFWGLETRFLGAGIPTVTF